MAKMPMPFSNPSTYKNHSGIDFGQPNGTPVYAIADGVITYRDQWGTWGTYNGKYQRGGGITSTITRPDGVKVLNCHLISLDSIPPLGTKVVKGKTIVGRVGNTGHSTGPHLHTEFWYNGNPLWEWDYMDRLNWIGKPQPPKPPAPAGEKGFTVVKKQYKVQDADSRNTAKPRIVLPGDGFWLNAKLGQPKSQATNIVGLPGPYEFALHAQGSGNPGDILQIQLWWDVPNREAHSGHYKARAIVDQDGFFALNASFLNNVSAGQKVYAQFRAGKNNRAKITMSLFDSDAWLLGTA